MSFSHAYIVAVTILAALLLFWNIPKLVRFKDGLGLFGVLCEVTIIVMAWTFIGWDL